MGLSPRVRGNHKRRRGRTPCSGSIPACAGEPSYDDQQKIKDGVYPRVCGGTKTHDFPERDTEGLSPRVRGNRDNMVYFIVVQGSIPACAGEPVIFTTGPLQRRVYPRVCGGTKGRLHAHKAVEGLSPRVRGNHAHPIRSGRRSGSIPACAGEPASGFCVG